MRRKTTQHTCAKNDSALIRARAFTMSFISLISLSMSVINWERSDHRETVGRRVGKEDARGTERDQTTDLDDKVDELVLVHLLGVKVGDEEADVIALT